MVIVCLGVGQVVLQVAAATPCQCSFGIEKSFWPALYAKVCLCQSNLYCVLHCVQLYVVLSIAFN